MPLHFPYNITLADEQQLRNYADFAFQRCCAWFGRPADADFRLCFVGAPFSGTSRSAKRRSYAIWISRQATSKEARLADLFHEMYHRVTMCCTGLRQELWVDETLAFLASQRLLQEAGLGQYAKLRLAFYFNPAKALAVPALKKARARKVLFGLYGVHYPEGFNEGVAVLGFRLDQLLEWEAICRLAVDKTWSEWLGQIRPELHGKLGELLMIDH
jgi:hypothetical protein